MQKKKNGSMAEGEKSSNKNPIVYINAWHN